MTRFLARLKKLEAAFHRRSIEGGTLSPVVIVTSIKSGTFHRTKDYPDVEPSVVSGVGIMSGEDSIWSRDFPDLAKFWRAFDLFHLRRTGELPPVMPGPGDRNE